MLEARHAVPVYRCHLTVEGHKFIQKVKQMNYEL